jgi:hypothetical protein
METIYACPKCGTLKSFGLIKRGIDNESEGEILYGLLACILSILSIVFLWVMQFY